MKMHVDLSKSNSKFKPTINAHTITGYFNTVPLCKDESEPTLAMVVQALTETGGSTRNASRRLKVDHALVMRTLIDHGVTKEQVMAGDVWLEPVVIMAPNRTERS